MNTELAEGIVDSDVLTKVGLGSIRTILDVSVVPKIGQILLLIVGPCLELVILTDM